MHIGRLVHFAHGPLPPELLLPLLDLLRKLAVAVLAGVARQVDPTLANMCAFDVRGSVLALDACGLMTLLRFVLRLMRENVTPLRLPGVIVRLLAL